MELDRFIHDVHAQLDTIARSGGEQARELAERLAAPLDSAIRLHLQVHPNSAFARRFLGSPSGKTEAYHVLATRPEVAQPYIYLGFQRPPSRDALRRMIESQDIAALEACFDKIPVRPGETYLVPGGVPHALGEGLFLVEIQEPTDLVVRFEFERAGYVLPGSARGDGGYGSTGGFSPRSSGPEAGREAESERT